MTELADLIARLEANPVWAMSLGSKELFHSNPLATAEAAVTGIPPRPPRAATLLTRVPDNLSRHV